MYIYVCIYIYVYIYIYIYIYLNICVGLTPNVTDPGFVYGQMIQWDNRR